MRDDKPVPEPGEAGRDDDEVHYYDVDETNVGESERREEPHEEEPSEPERETS